MRRFQRLLLWLFSLLMPMTIAACYGTYMEYDCNGEIPDRYCDGQRNCYQCDCNGYCEIVLPWLSLHQ